MRIFSVGKLFCTSGAGDDASYVRFGETKDKYFNRSLRHGTEMRHQNLRSDSVHTGYIGTGAILVPGWYRDVTTQCGMVIPQTRTAKLYRKSCA